MKNLTRSILILLFLFPLVSHAQDWRCVRDTVTTIFVDTMHYQLPYTESKTMWVVNIDSMNLYQGYTYCYGFPKVRFVSVSYHNGTYFADYCYNANGASRIGTAMSTGESGTYFFNSAGDAVRICTERKANQPWICCRITDTTHLDAVVTSLGIETVLGVSDSVKYISFQAKRNNTGELLPHPLNTKTFKVSKRFGMLTLYDFYQFPNYDSLKSPIHNLAGIASQGQVSGEQNLMMKEIYSYGPGDVFHTFNSGWSDPHSASSETKIVNIVLDSLWNSTKDTVTYKIRRYINDWIGFYDFEHTYSIDTVFKSYTIHSDACLGIDNYPEQTHFCYDSAGVLTSVNSFKQQRSPAYNARWVKSEGNDISPISFCADTLVGVSIPGLGYTSWTYYYIEGCGGPYFDGYYQDDYHDPHSTFYKLVYFKKGSESWGIPLDTTDWHVPHSIIENAKVKFKLYPNPSGDLVTVEIPGMEKGNYRVEITCLMSVKIAEMNINAEKFTFPVNNFSKGMYILKLFKDNQLGGQQKLIKN